MPNDGRGRRDYGDHERTPLLKRAAKKVKGVVASITEDQEYDTDTVRQSKDDKHKVDDLGPFEHQPYQYYGLFGDKDAKGLEKLGGLDGILKALKTDAKKGLTSDQISSQGEEFQHRQRIYGKNSLPEKRMKSFVQFLFEALNDKVLLILIVAAIVSFGLGLYQDFGPSHDPNEPRVNWVEGLAIMIAVVIVVLVSSINDYSKEKQFKKLNDRKESVKVTVKRDGRNRSVDSGNVVVGDVLSVEAGHIMTCDALFLRGHDVRCDESGATGESDAIKKCDLKMMQEKGNEDSKADCFLLSGSKLLEGSCTCLVLAVGQDSFQGRIFMDLRSSQPSTTRMQKQLGHLAEQIARIATIIGGILLVILLIRAGIDLKEFPDRPSSAKVQSFIQAFVIAVTLIVVAVPEGLPLAVTLALAFASQRMTKHDLLVRVFEACETMSNANVIVTDKTGTLTQNVMTVVTLLLGDTEFHRDDKNDQDRNEDDPPTENGHGHSPESKQVKNLSELSKGLKDPLKELLTSAFAVNSTAYENERNTEDGESEFVGSNTEIALLRLMQELDLGDYHQIRDDADILRMIPFSSARKAMGVVVASKDGATFHAKGASEMLIKLCTKQIDFSKSTEAISTFDMTEDHRKTLSETIQNYAERSLRTIALCHRQVDSESANDKCDFDDLAKDLTLIALVGIQDPLRDNATQSVADCHKAGCDVIMCTGDNLLTAKAIAKQCGILDENGKALDGAEYRKMSKQQKADILPQLKVLARSLPDDKEDLVRTLQEEADKIVCVTGDGTNDAMAIKRADIGFSMGMSGTEVAKEASDVVLTTDNFGSIVDAIIWGRCVSDAVRKFLQFQLAVNVTAIVITFVSSVAGGDENSVLNAVQLLWVNLIMDTFAALALATDKADPSLLDRKPENRNAPIMNVTMIKMITAQATFQTLVTLLLHFGGRKIVRPLVGHDQTISDVEFTTLVFNVFVWCQIFNLINCRRIDNGFNILENAFNNIWLLGILLVMIGGQILIVFVGGPAFGVTPISIRLWALSIGIGFLSLLVGALVRFLPIDKPLQKLLVRLHLMTDPEELPHSNERHADQSQGTLEDTIQMIQHIRSGRYNANTIHYWHTKHTNDGDKSSIRGLLMLPAFLVGKAGQ